MAGIVHLNHVACLFNPYTVYSEYTRYSVTPIPNFHGKYHFGTVNTWIVVSVQIIAAGLD